MTLERSRRARPIGDGGGRSIGWWGAIFGLLTLAHLVAGLLVAAVYLRAFTQTWPPHAGPTPGMLLSTLAMVLAAIGVLAAHWAGSRVRQGRGQAPLILASGAILILAAAIVRGADTIFSSWPVTDHAYWSIRWALGAMDVLLLATLTGVTALGAVHIARGSFRRFADAEVAVVRLWGWATLALVGVAWLVFGAVTGWRG